MLDAVGDASAAPLLEQLFADVLARAAELADARDRERGIHVLPVFLGIAAACNSIGGALTAAA